MTSTEYITCTLKQTGNTQ